MYEYLVTVMYDDGSNKATFITEKVADSEAEAKMRGKNLFAELHPEMVGNITGITVELI